MRKNVLRIFSSLLAVVMLSVAIVPASAADGFGGGSYGGGAGRSDFFTWTNGFGGGRYGGGASRGDSESAYDAYVQELPATGYTSSGGLRITVPVTYAYTIASGTIFSSCSHYPSGVIHDSKFNFFCDEGTHNVRISALSGNTSINRNLNLYFAYCFVAPVSGLYSTDCKMGSGYMISVTGESSLFSPFCASKSAFYEEGYEAKIELNSTGFAGSAYSVVSFNPLPLVFDIIPDTAPSADTYNTTTRPTSITGGNYGIVGDNGQITRVEDNSTIINETNNTYYNPATGQTQPITAWSYDYSDRSYKVTLDGGNTSTVTYGDENISITETTVNESGDTITNNYTIYYLIDGSGETPVDPPAACEHDWQEASSTDSTCTLPGKVTLSCTKCQQTKTETIPALGHDWQLKQTVTTQYDDTGQLTQQGYTIFECSRCHEQYKSTDGTIPPGGGSGTDPGGEEGETTIGGLIEKLLSGVGSIVGGIIKGLLSLLTKAVEALAGLAELFTTFVGSLVELWGGFTSFLSAVFPFLPEEFVVIIELGLILMIAAAVFRKFIS